MVARLPCGVEVALVRCKGGQESCIHRAALHQRDELEVGGAVCAAERAHVAVVKLQDHCRILVFAAWGILSAPWIGTDLRNSWH